MKHTARKMRETDLTRVAMFLEECYGELAAREGMGEPERRRLIEARGSEAALRSQMEEYVFYLLERESIPAGLVALKDNEITKLYVGPAHQGSGLGRILFEVAQRIIVRRGYDSILVGTTAHAVPFYESMGMSVEGRRPAPAGPLAGREITILKKELHTLTTTIRLPHDGRVHL